MFVLTSELEAKAAWKRRQNRETRPSIRSIFHFCTKSVCSIANLNAVILLVFFSFHNNIKTGKLENSKGGTRRSTSSGRVTRWLRPRLKLGEERLRRYFQKTKRDVFSRHASQWPMALAVERMRRQREKVWINWE